MHNLATIYAANLLAGDLVKCGPDDFRRVARVTTMNEGRYVSIVWERHTVPAGKNLWTAVRAERRMRVVPALVTPMGRSMGAGTACTGHPWNVRGCETAESWADVWNAWAERRSEAAASVPLAANAVHGWQVVGGVTSARLMAAGKPLTRYGRDRGIVVTPAGLAALDRHRVGRVLADGAYRASGADAYGPTPCDCDAEGFTHGRRSTCPREV